MDRTERGLMLLTVELLFWNVSGGDNVFLLIESGN